MHMAQGAPGAGLVASDGQLRRCRWQARAGIKAHRSRSAAEIFPSPSKLECVSCRDRHVNISLGIDHVLCGVLNCSGWSPGSPHDLIQAPFLSILATRELT